MTLPLVEARRNDEIISLADSQVLRWLDELNGVVDAEEKAKAIKREIRHLKKEPNSLTTKKRIRQLYTQLDEIQFKPDYMCLIIDKERDYHRARQGFSINGLKYKRLLGTNGGVKNETIVFISERHEAEIKRRIENGRDPETKLVPAKLEAYRALTCSASIPVSLPNGILVVPDCETQFVEDIIYMDDEGRIEPLMELREKQVIDLDESDGYGLMLPSLAQRWSEELSLDYMMGGCNTRFAWEKGMVFTFDFVEFAEKVAGNYLVKDAWGNEVDIRQVELILTTSMLKLYDSYKSCKHYLECCNENGYSIGITKTCPKELESERNLNYQFIQSYNLNDEDIDELIRPTADEIEAVLHGDVNKTVLFLKGAGLNDRNIMRQENDYTKALMIDPRMINDPFVQSCIYNRIKNRIDEAKVGVLKVHGNYSMISGDPYSLCQSIFGLPVTGLLKAGEIYNGYWRGQEADRLVCFRAPMTSHNNIRAVSANKDPEADYWYRYMQTCTVMNSWDSAAHALNGADKDGDLVMLTDNKVLVNRHNELPTIMCVQRKAEKKIVNEDDVVAANIASFGDDIGKTTNWITSMFEVQSRFEEDSPEYKELDYRIKTGQLFQQNSIDKAKGIIAQPMPRNWHDRHSVNVMDDPDQKRFYLRLVADKKPYFMTYIYPSLMHKYNTYIQNTNKMALREFQLTMEDLLALPEDELTDRQQEFVRYYKTRLPIGDGPCVMNRICHKIENQFDHYLSQKKALSSFDYSIMKSGAQYTASQFNSISKLRDEFNRQLQRFSIHLKYERMDTDSANAVRSDLVDWFVRECSTLCPNQEILCNIVLDICYSKNMTKRFAWVVCGDQIIENLLRNNNWIVSYPELSDEDEGLVYCGKRFKLVQTNVEELYGIGIE